MTNRTRHSREAQRSAAAATFRGQIIALLGDGKPRDSQTILDEGRKKGLFTPVTTQRSVYENMLLYMQQEAANGRKAAVVEDPISRKFRINRPVDDWPDVALQPRPRYIDAPALDAISTRLRTTAVGKDSTAFEVAVCDAFALFGFVSRHVGGMYAPDGILDAPLGPLAYRAVLECKSTPHTKFVSQPRPESTDKFRRAANADFGVLVGPVLHGGPSFAQEIETHAISVWTVDDVITALRLDVDTHDCRDLFTPGFVYDRLTDLEWNRNHGAEKRAAVVRQIAAKATPPSARWSAKSPPPTRPSSRSTPPCCSSKPPSAAKAPPPAPPAKKSKPPRKTSPAAEKPSASATATASSSGEAEPARK